MRGRMPRSRTWSARPSKSVMPCSITPRWHSLISRAGLRPGSRPRIMVWLPYGGGLTSRLLTAGNKTYTMSAILHSRCRDTTTRPDSTSHGPPPDMTQDTELNALLLDSLDSFCRDWRAQHPLPNVGVDNPPRPLDNSLWED